MQFNSLDDAFSNNFIKSLPHLTRLNLSANEKLVIELVLSFKHKGLDFYMNHATIAEYLALGDTKTKAKSVGSIIAKLRKKGYIETVTTHNYNGKNGGSSTSVTVNETFLEAQLHATFNPETVLEQNAVEPLPILELIPVERRVHSEDKLSEETLPINSKTKRQTNEEFLAELEAMEDEPRPTVNLPYLVTSGGDDSTDNEQEDYGYMELETMEGFKLLLQGLMGFEDMYSKRGMLQSMIDNEQGWNLETMKEAFGSVILR